MEDVLCLDVVCGDNPWAVATATAAVGTAPLVLSDATCQTHERRDAAVQSEQAVRQPQQQQVKGAADAAAAGAALAQAAPRMLHRMLEALAVGPVRSLGGTGLVAGSRQQHSINASSAQLLHTLAASTPAAAGRLRAAAASQQPQAKSSTSSSSSGSSSVKGLVVTGLSWNSTGHTLAAVFGRHDIVGWCNRPGAVATWNLARSGGGSNAAVATTPDVLLTTACCMTACAFHPTEPALLAGGTFNGEVVLWDLTKDAAAGEDPQVAQSGVLGDARHREPVTALAWLFSAAEARRHGTAGGRACTLLSLSADGRLLVWGCGKLGTPLLAYELRSPLLHAHGTFGSGAAALAPPGGTCLALGASSAGTARSSTAAEAAATAFVGTEGGALLRCHLPDPDDTRVQDFAVRLAGGGGAAGTQQGAGASGGVGAAPAVLPSPVRESGYERPTGGPVTDAAASPFVPAAVLAAGADGCVRLFHALRRAPALRLHASAGPLRGVQWSPAAPLVFAVATRDGAVLLYSLEPLAAGGGDAGQLLAPVLSLPTGGGGRCGADGSHAGAGWALTEFNSAIPGLIATGGHGGDVQVWRLPGTVLCPPLQQATAAKQLAALLER